MNRSHYLESLAILSKRKGGRRMSQLLTIDELAAWLKLPKATLYNFTHEKRIPYLKVGRRLRFDSKQIQEWLERRAHAVELAEDATTAAGQRQLR